MVELVWDGKYDDKGKRVAPLRIALPFQTIETVNESALERQHSFAKLPQRFGFTIEYTDSATNLRYYKPDFVAVTPGGEHFVLETKGREDIDVVYKDRAARAWCENATLLTDTTWQYFKVPQLEFEKLQPSELAEVVIAFGDE